MSDSEIRELESPLCANPNNADSFPSSPVPVVAGACTNYQYYEAASPHIDSGTCGFIVAFGPMGQLMHPADRYTLRGDWVTTPDNEADCNRAYTVASAWGHGCIEGACRSQAPQWHHIGSKTRWGSWNATTQTCYLEASFSVTDASFTTVQIAVEAHQLVPAFRSFDDELRQAKASIRASSYNGLCVSVPAS